MNDQNQDFAQKLERLFEEVRKPNGKRFTQAEVVEGTGGILTRVYLWKLRTGKALNPGFHIVRAITDFFGVDPGYFFESQAASELPPSGRYIQEITQRASRLDDRGRKMILDLIDYILDSRK